jgi:hypothetical protein
MLCFNTLRNRITEDNSCAKENSPTDALKTSSIELVNKTYESLQSTGITGLQGAGGEYLQEIELGAGDTEDVRDHRYARGDKEA